jgi:L-asparagine transporter-like permease
MRLVRATYARRLGLFDGTLLVIGGIIGAGIFLNSVKRYPPPVATTSL